MTLRVVPTRNLAIVREIIVEEGTWERVSDDRSPPRDAYQVPELGTWLALMSGEDESWTIHGFVWGAPVSLFEVRVTPVIRAEHKRDKRVVELVKMAYQWLWNNSSAIKLSARISNEDLRFAQRTGLQREGVAKKSIVKDGEVLDQFYMGITKE